MMLAQPGVDTYGNYLPGYLVGEILGGALAALYVSKMSLTLARIH